MEKYDTIDLIDLGEGYEYYITPAPKFGKTFKPIVIESTSYDEGEGYPDVVLYEVKWLGVDAWDIFDDVWFNKNYSEVNGFAQEILEKFYKLVELNDPKVQEYIV